MTLAETSLAFDDAAVLLIFLIVIYLASVLFFWYGFGLYLMLIEACKRVGTLLRKLI